MHKLFFFGDSICVGQHVSVHKTWVHRIARELDKNFNTVVLNASVNGNTTRMALERMHFDVLSHKPDIVYIQFGLNDCNYWATDNGCPRVSVDAYIANIKEMIDKSLAAGVREIIISSNHRSSKTTSLMDLGFSYEDSNTIYYKALVEFVNSKVDNICFLDVRKFLDSKVNDPRQYLLHDGIHLNELGHDCYYQYLLPKIINRIGALTGVGVGAK